MSLLRPSSVAVVGASADEQKIGHLILKNLVEQGFSGNIFPVNPKGGSLLGKTVFASVSAIPTAPDLVVIVTPAQTVAGLVEECGKKKVRSVVIVSSGFGETGAKGKKLEEELKSIADRYRMQLIGPNCLGIMRPSISMNASFGNRLPPKGSVALLSQSGALGQAFIDRAETIGLGLSLFVSMGNKAAMDECDFLELCRDDDETKVIGLYLENIRDGHRFLELGKRIGKRKPIVLLKAGTTERGGRAVSSHTGALAGSDATVEAICAQSGMRRATTADDFLDVLRTLSLLPPLLSPNIAIITNAGGPGVLATDAAEREKLSLPSLSPAREQTLKTLLPESASVRNPIDVLGDALEDRYVAALEAAAEDENIDGAIIILTPQVVTPSKNVAEAIIRAKQSHPLFPFLTCFMGGSGVTDAIAHLQRNGIPNVTSPEVAVRMLKHLRAPEHPPAERKTVEFNAKRAAKAAKLLRETGTGLVGEEQTEKLFSLYDLPLPKGRVATTAEEAIAIATEIGYPVTAKISSKDILHKTEVGGVRVNLTTAEELKQAYKQILASAAKKAPQATVRGVLIQQSLPPGSEFIVGILRDPSIGHLVMAGLGGIYTELFSDVSFRVAPLSESEAFPMLAGLKSWKLLMGMRGKNPLDVDALAELISTLSVLANECPLVKEIDLNPVLVAEEGLTILDAKVVVKES